MLEHERWRYLSIEHIHEIDFSASHFTTVLARVNYAMNLTSLVSEVAAPALSAFAAWKA